jgi:hypothetical protein
MIISGFVLPALVAGDLLPDQAVWFFFNWMKTLPEAP